MLTYALRRLGVAIPTLVGVTLVVFVLTHIVPGDPATTLVGENASPIELARAREFLNLDRPLHEQYAVYLQNLSRGDLGLSISGRPVLDEFAIRFPATVELTLAALLYAIALGIPLGRFAARFPGRFGDVSASFVGVLGLSIPSFVLGLLFQSDFAVELGIFPAAGRVDPRLLVPSVTNFVIIDAALAGNWDAIASAASHLVLPAVTLGSLPLAYISRLTRSAILEARNEDYVRTARSKGLGEGAIVDRHIMPNAWLPVVTVIGLQVGTLLSGAVVTEIIFAWNGVGSWVVSSIQSHDYVVVQSAVLLFACLFLVVNLIVDLTYAVLDPRIRYG